MPPWFKPAARAEHYPAPRACSSSESHAKISWCTYNRMPKMSLTPTLISVTVGERGTVTYQLRWPTSPQSTDILRTALSARLDNKSDAPKFISKPTSTCL